MNYAPLQPLRLGVKRVAIDPMEPAPEVGRQSRLPQVTLNVQMGEGIVDHAIAGYHYEVAVRVPVDVPDHPSPYRIEITVFGLFAFPTDAGVTEQRRRELATYNAIAMLYGLARDTVLDITARGVYGPFILPSVELVSVANNLLAQMVGDTTAAAAATGAAGSQPVPERPARRRTSRPSRKPPGTRQD